MNLHILQSITTGILIAVIPGPIFFEIVKRTIAKGFTSGILVSIGEFLGNFLLLTLVYFEASLIFKNNLSLGIFSIIGAIVLIYSATKSFNIKEECVNKMCDGRVEKRNSFLKGFLISISSFLTIPIWFSLSVTYLKGFSSTTYTFLSIFLICFGFLIFSFLLVYILNIIRRKISAKYVVLISKISSIVLFLFALYFVYSGIKLFL